MMLARCRAATPCNSNKHEKSRGRVPGRWRRASVLPLFLGAVVVRSGLLAGNGHAMAM